MRMLIPLLALLVGVPVAQAQSRVDEDTLATYEHDPIVVTGTRAQVARSNVPLTVSTVTGTSIERSGETNVLPLVSRHVPGMFVTERGMVGFGVADGSAGQIRIRGVGGSPNTNVLVMVDGHPQFMGIFGHPFPDAYVSTDVERVEIVRGPASILYGTGAMGGVLNIITRRMDRDGVRAAASAAYGSHATQHYAGSAGVRSRGREAFLSLNHDRTDGHRDAKDEFRVTNAWLKLGAPVATRWRFSADGQVTRFYTEDPGPSFQEPGESRPDAEVLRTRVGLSLENAHPRTEGALKAYVNYGEHEITDGFESEDHNYGLVAYQAYRVVPELVVTIGADAKRYGGASRNVLVGADFGDHAVTEVGGYGLIQFTLRRSLVVSGGARLESHSEFGAEFAPQVGLAYQVARATTLRASVARGFRSPTVLELYLFPPANQDLEPERMWNYEAGVAHVRGRFHAELVGFISEGSNLIEVQMGPTGPRRNNVGSFSNRGLELQAGYLLATGLAISGNTSYLFMQTPIVGAPEWHAFADLTYANGPFTGGVEVELVDGLYLGTFGAEEGARRVEAYALVNARAGYRFLGGTEFFIRLENLAGTSYEMNAGYPMPGRTVMTGLRYQH